MRTVIKAVFFSGLEIGLPSVERRTKGIQFEVLILYWSKRLQQHQGYRFVACVILSFTYIQFRFRSLVNNLGHCIYIRSPERSKRLPVTAGAKQKWGETQKKLNCCVGGFCTPTHCVSRVFFVVVVVVVGDL